MKRRVPARILLTLLLILVCSACAPMMAASAVSTLATGKSMTDHAASITTQTDCSSIGFVTGQQDYWCERARDAGTTYNRTRY